MQPGPTLSSPRSDRLLLALLDRFGDDEAIAIGHARISTGAQPL